MIIHKSLTFKLRRDTAAAWVQKNPVLAEGEPGYEKDTGQLRIGDGVTAWIYLPHVSPDARIQTMIDASIAAAGGFPDGPEDDGTSFLLLYENAKV